MSKLSQIYKGSLSLLTDLYQVTMAYGYWKNGMAEQNASFSMYFRSNPFEGGYSICSGMEQVLDYLENWQITANDIDYLKELESSPGTLMFEQEFLDYLQGIKLTVDVDAVPEGNLIFPFEPVMQVTGPILQCQLLETPLLNLVGFPSLIATKAARICSITKDEPVMEFGLRRAQGIDGGLTASRAAYIGGCASTSNVLAGKMFGIPVAGTHAHSWVTSFEEEKDAFRSYAQAMPDNCILLVDTYDTIRGINNAIEVGLELKEKGYNLKGIRLDSGDLAYFGKIAREKLDNVGLSETKIVASGDINEHIANTLHQQDSQITLWGIGTKLVTGEQDPSMGIVYKLAAIETEDGWSPRIKLSEQSIKVNVPTIQGVKRIEKNGKYLGDLIYNRQDPPEGNEVEIVSPADPTRTKKINLEEVESKELLVSHLEKGKVVRQEKSLKEIRDLCQEELGKLDPAIKRLVNPHDYPAGFERKLHNLRHNLILELKNKVK